MGAGCSTGAARHVVVVVEGATTGAPPPPPSSDPWSSVHGLLKDGRVAVYQHSGSGACVLVPLGGGADASGGSTTTTTTAAAAAAERRLGPDWRRVPVSASAQARVLEALGAMPARPSSSSLQAGAAKATATATTSTTATNNAPAAASGGGEASGEEAADDEALSVGEPVEEAWPPSWAEAGGKGEGEGEGEDDDEGIDEEDEDPLVAAQRRQRRQQGPLAPALRCRVCGREVPNKALLNEHLAACLLVAEAREQTRGTDDGLRMLAGDLRRLLEEQMRAALHGGAWVGVVIVKVTVVGYGTLMTVACGTFYIRSPHSTYAPTCMYVFIPTSVAALRGRRGAGAGAGGRGDGGAGGAGGGPGEPRCVVVLGCTCVWVYVHG